MTLNTVFFDVNGTISDSKYWCTLQPDEYDAVQREIFEGDHAVLNAWMRGQLSSEEVCEHISGKTGICSEYLFKQLRLSCQQFKITPSAIRALSSARAKYNVAIVTTNMDCFTRFVLLDCKLRGLFQVLNSSDYGKLKEDDDGEIFDHAAALFGTSIKKCALIDDSAFVRNLFSRKGGHVRAVSNPRKVYGAYKDLHQQEMSF